METRKEKVLVVDDENSVRTALRFMVEKIGYGAVEAANGELALKELARHGHNIVAAIVDIYMPIMNGLQLLERIRVIRRDLPVIMSSATYNSDIEAFLEPHGLYSFLMKPYRFSCFKLALSRAIASAGQKPMRSVSFGRSRYT